MGYTQAILMNILAILIQLLWKPRYSWKSEAGSHEKMISLARSLEEARRILWSVMFTREWRFS